MNVAQACQRLANEGLVVWSSGNASERAGQCMLIKPSGIVCGQVRAFVQMQLSDGAYAGTMKPSTDAGAHRYIYNHLPEIGGIVHTHSPYATAYAVAGKPIPCCMTMMHDEFGDEIPVSQYCEIGNEDIGQEVVRLYQPTKVPAILIRHHGVFCVGRTLEAAVKTAVLTELCAKTAFLATRMANPMVHSRDKIERNHKRYQESYGQ